MGTTEQMHAVCLSPSAADLQLQLILASSDTDLGSPGGGQMLHLVSSSDAAAGLGSPGGVSLQLV